MAYDMDGKETIIAEGLDSNDLAVTHKGEIYVSDPPNKQVWFINAKHEKRVVDTGIARPNGVLLTPDQSLLLVADTAGQMVYSFQIQPDGSLTHKQPYFHLHLAIPWRADGMTSTTRDSLRDGRSAGCDQAGRVNAVFELQRARFPAVFGGWRSMASMLLTGKGL